MKALSLTSECNALHSACTKSRGETVHAAFDYGRVLKAIKESLPHGMWQGWADRHLDFTDRTARQYMRLHTNLEHLSDSERKALIENGESIKKLCSLKPVEDEKKIDLEIGDTDIPKLQVLTKHQDVAHSDITEELQSAGVSEDATAGAVGGR